MPAPTLHLPVWPFWVAGAVVRGGLRAARHRAADLSPPRRLLHQEPRVRHHARADGDRLRAAGRAARRDPADAGLVSRAWMAVTDAAPAMRTSSSPRSSRGAGPAVRARHVEPREVRGARRRAARPGRAAEVRARRHDRPGAGRRARARRCGRRCTRCCSARAAATWSSARTSCCAIPTRFTSAATSSSTTTACSTRRARPTAGIRIGDGVFIGRNTILSCKNGDIELADGANIGFNCEVFSASRVTIGASVLMAAYGYVIGGDHDFSDPSKPVLEQTRTSAGVTIGDGAWMGAGAKILDGVTIGDARGHRRRRGRARERRRDGDRRRHPGARRRVAVSGSRRRSSQVQSRPP